MDTLLEKLTKNFLHYFGNKNPTEDQRTLMQALLAGFILIRKLSMRGGVTEQEIACLFFAALGIDIYQSAEILRINKETVKEYRQNIIRKLHCKNMNQAIFITMLL